MKRMFVLGLGLLCFSGSASALDLGVGLKAGTLGAGVDVSVAITRTINLRLALTNIDIEGQEETISVGDSGAEADIDAELDADYGANALLVDWYVFDGTFHLTAGMLKNNGKLDFSGALLNGGTIDGQDIEPEDLNGSIGGSVSLGESYQPYVGIGFGRKAGYDPGLSFTVELGVALLDPGVDLEANLNVASTTGNFADQAELNQTLRDAESDAEAELDDFEFFPVFALGVNYAF